MQVDHRSARSETGPANCAEFPLAIAANAGGQALWLSAPGVVSAPSEPSVELCSERGDLFW